MLSAYQGIKAFEQVANRLLVEKVNTSSTTIEVRTEFLITLDGSPVPPLDSEVGGYSGAPLLLESSLPGRMFEFGGVLSEGGLSSFTKENSLKFYAEPPSCIRADGRVWRDVTKSR